MNKKEQLALRKELEKKQEIVDNLYKDLISQLDSLNIKYTLGGKFLITSKIDFEIKEIRLSIIYSLSKKEYLVTSFNGVVMVNYTFSTMKVLNGKNIRGIWFYNKNENACVMINLKGEK